MGKGGKFIIIGLLILLLVSVYFLLYFFKEGQTVQQGYDEVKEKLNTQTSNWSSKVSRLKKDKQGLESQISQLEENVGSIKSERDKAQEKYNLLLQEKEELVEKLQSLAAARREEPIRSIIAPAEPSMMDSDEYWASILKNKADLELRLSDLKEVVTDLQFKLDAVTKEKTNLALELSKLEQDNQDLARKVDYNERLAGNLSADLMREQKDKKGILGQFTKIKQENVSLRSRIKSLDKANLSLKKKLRSIEEERHALDERIDRMSLSLEKSIEEVAQATEDIKFLSQAKPNVTTSQDERRAREVDLPPIVVRSSSRSSSGRQDAINNLRIISGKIIAINEANNFVVVNLGEHQGVTIGRKFDVYRNNVSIARLEVIQARKNISAADIIRVSPKRKVRIGDIIK